MLMLGFRMTDFICLYYYREEVHVYMVLVMLHLHVSTMFKKSDIDYCLKYLQGGASQL